MGGFVREGSSDDYVLLGGGGHKLLSEIRGTVYDAEIEYLENTGTQYIDTGLLMDYNSVIEASVMPTSINTGENFNIFGQSLTTTWENDWSFGFDNETFPQRIIYVPASNSFLNIGEYSLNTRYNISANNTGIRINDTLYTKALPGGYAGNKTMYIFGSNRGTSSFIGKGKGRLYSFKVYNGTTLVFDAIPVRVGNVGYFYDKVSGELFGNSGTGSFVLGPDKEYLPLSGGTLTGQVTATRFVKSGSSDSYVLLGGGGHKLESDLSVAYAGSARVATVLGKYIDNRSTDNLPSYYYENGFSGCGAVSSEFARVGSAHGYFETRITTVPWWDTSGGRPVQLALANSGAYLRTAASRTQWNQWQTIITNTNIENYTPNLYDAEIEYLGIKGCNVELPFYPSTNYKYYWKVSFNTIENWNYLFRADGDIGNWFIFGGTETSSRPQLHIVSSCVLSSVSLQTNTLYECYLGHESNSFVLKYNDTITNTLSYVNFTSSKKLHINGQNCNFYYLKVYNENDNLIYDFIPVRVGQVGYLYDKMSGQLFGNSGSGSFVLGQDIGSGGGLTYPYLPLAGGTITGNLRVNGNRCFLCNTTADNARVNISDSAQIVKTNESYNPYLLFHIPNTSWGRIEYSSSGQFHFKDGQSGSAYMSLYAASFNQGSDIRKKNIIDNVNINIYDIANAPLFKFTWKDESKYSGLHIGSSAQYWQTILPELTSIANDSDQTLSMQYDVISLVSSIIVAKKTVENEQNINCLESQITQLRNEILNLKISDSN